VLVNAKQEYHVTESAANNVHGSLEGRQVFAASEEL
jgi:hypothetical protein